VSMKAWDAHGCQGEEDLSTPTAAAAAGSSVVIVSVPLGGGKGDWGHGNEFKVRSLDVLLNLLA